jgi:hypothetical protein
LGEKPIAIGIGGESREPRAANRPLTMDHGRSSMVAPKALAGPKTHSDRDSDRGSAEHLAPGAEAESREPRGARGRRGGDRDRDRDRDGPEGI